MADHFPPFTLTTLLTDRVTPTGFTHLRVVCVWARAYRSVHYEYSAIQIGWLPWDSPVPPEAPTLFVSLPSDLLFLSGSLKNKNNFY